MRLSRRARIQVKIPKSRWCLKFLALGSGLLANLALGNE
eukprot:gene5311-7083_t